LKWLNKQIPLVRRNCTQIPYSRLAFFSCLSFCLSFLFRLVIFRMCGLATEMVSPISTWVESGLPIAVVVWVVVAFEFSDLKKMDAFPLLTTVACDPSEFTMVDVLPLLITVECDPSEFTMVAVFPFLITVEWPPSGFTMVAVFPLSITVECDPSELTMVDVLPLLITIEWVPSELTITDCATALQQKKTDSAKMIENRFIFD
jgi:hypothetical protein